MRRLALIGFVLIVAAMLAIAQQTTQSAQKQGADSQTSTQAQSASPAKTASSKPQEKPQPAIGTLTAKAKPLNFFSRGEGTLTIKGKGFILVGDLQGQITTNGFKEQKTLPRGVKLNPPWDKRLRIFMGEGTMTIQGKYDSVRGSMREGSLDFRGGAAFNLGGTGEALVDGTKKVNLFASATVTLFVPEPEFFKNPPKPDIEPMPYKKQ